MVRRVLLAVVALAVTVAVVLVGVLDLSGSETEEPPASFATTPLAEVDTLAMTVPRAGFCDRVDPREVEAALGGEVESSDEYANGDEVELADGVVDVAHEFGCVWSGPDGVTARAWVFAPPVDRTRARRLVEDAAAGAECERLTAAAFGAPTVALTCGPTTSYRGLFGDAWLVCSLTGAGDADAWCSAVARAASAPPASD